MDVHFVRGGIMRRDNLGNRIGELLNDEFESYRKVLDQTSREIRSAVALDPYINERIGKLEAQVSGLTRFTDTIIGLLPALAPILEQSMKAAQREFEEEY